MFECELRLADAQGTMRWVRVCGRAVRTGARRCVAALTGTIQEAAIALQSSDVDAVRLLVRAAETLDLGAWDLDVNRRRFSACRRLAELFGLPTDTLLDSDTIFSRIHPIDAPGVLGALNDVIGNPDRNHFTYEYRLHLAGGEERWLRTIGSVVARAPDGRALRLTGVTTDVSEQHQVDAVPSEADERLDQLTRLSAIGFFASAITHELNQPLTALANNLSACEIALHQSSTSRLALDLLDSNKRLVQRIAEIIRRTRSFVTSGEVVRVRGSLIDAIRASAEKVQKLAAHRDLHIRYALDPDGDDVEADIIQLEHVFYNLIRNAAEATEGLVDRQIAIELTTCGSHVEIHFVDNGQGFEGDNLERLFEPLWTSKQNGTGLGLAICRTIVEAHDGVITAAPGLDGRGLDIHLVMPIRARPAQPAS